MLNGQSIQVENIQVKIGNKINKGRGYTVYQGVMTDNGSLVAIKLQESISDHDLNILKTLLGKKFDHLIQVFAFEVKEDAVYILMELGGSIDLKSLPDKRRTCLQIAKGVSELHQLGLFHQDLKPQNYVIGKDNKIKLIGFGITKNINKQTQTRQMGTSIYMAPEVCENKKFDQQVDIWSLGMIFYEIFTNNKFFENVEEFMKGLKMPQKLINKKISEHNNLEQWKKKLLQKMLIQILHNEVNSIKRISIYEVIKELSQIPNEWQEDLYEILVSQRDIDEQFLGQIIEESRKKKSSNILEFLSKKTENLNHQANLKSHKIIKLIKILRNIKYHDFNENNYSTQTYRQTRQQLINKIKKNNNIVEFLIFLVRLTAIDNQFIQSGSNSINLLVEMKVDLTNQSLEDIRIKNTSLIGGNFEKCNFSGSEFNNVNINRVKLDGAKLLNCKWQNLKTYVLNKLNGHSQSVNSVCFSPDGNTLVSGSSDNSICLWDVKTGQQKTKLNGHTSTVYSVCFSPDGSTLATGGGDNFIYLWDLKTRKLKAKLGGHEYQINSVCFSSDGLKLASCSGPKQCGDKNYDLDINWHYLISSIYIWDAKKGQNNRLYSFYYDEGFFSVSFSPDGTTLASVSLNSIWLWDVQTKSQKSKLYGHRSFINSVCFSPDGYTLASGSQDSSICLWDVKACQQKAILIGHSDKVYSVSFSPDSSTLASGSKDKSIRLWDVKACQQIAILNGHSDTVYSVSFSPEGSTLVSGSKDKSIRLWDVQAEQKIEHENEKYKNIQSLHKCPTFQYIQHLKNDMNQHFVSSKDQIVQAYGTQIIKGEFINHNGFDLCPLLKSQGAQLFQK